MITRRDLLIGIAAAVASAPRASFAQQRSARIAWLSSGSASAFAYRMSAFKQGLREHGLIEGTHYILDERWAEGRYDRFPALAGELLQREPDVIVVGTIAAVQTVQQATKTVPIVFVSVNDPVGSGLVASLARPGGNTTGVANLAEDTTAKQLEALSAVAPNAKRVAALLNAGNPSHAKMFDNARSTAGSLGLTLRRVDLKSPDEVEAAFSSLVRERADAVLVLADAMLFELSERISALALKHRLPVTGIPDSVETGALIGYGSPRAESYRLAGAYVKKILAGARTADLPVEQAKRIELWLNLRTARALGIAIPQTVLARADRVIE